MEAKDESPFMRRHFISLFAALWLHTSGICLPILPWSENSYLVTMFTMKLTMWKTWNPNVFIATFFKPKTQIHTTCPKIDLHFSLGRPKVWKWFREIILLFYVLSYLHGTPPNVFFKISSLSPKLEIMRVSILSCWCLQSMSYRIFAYNIQLLQLHTYIPDLFLTFFFKP